MNHKSSDTQKMKNAVLLPKGHDQFYLARCLLNKLSLN